VASVRDDEGGYVVYSDNDQVSGYIADYVARHDPARVLAECEAKRQIVAELERLRSLIPEYVIGDGDEHEQVIVEWAESAVLSQLASVYADHPDFDPAWLL
jgi:hypothetical protein